MHGVFRINLCPKFGIGRRTFPNYISHAYVLHVGLSCVKPRITFSRMSCNPADVRTVCCWIELIGKDSEQGRGDEVSGVLENYAVYLAV
jgi:hypothetical protein